jgi:hypothetical protein
MLAPNPKRHMRVLTQPFRVSMRTDGPRKPLAHHSLFPVPHSPMRSRPPHAAGRPPFPPRDRAAASSPLRPAAPPPHQSPFLDDYLLDDYPTDEDGILAAAGHAIRRAIELHGMI